MRKIVLTLPKNSSCRFKDRQKSTFVWTKHRTKNPKFRSMFVCYKYVPHASQCNNNNKRPKIARRKSMHCHYMEFTTKQFCFVAAQKPDTLVLNQNIMFVETNMLWTWKKKSNNNQFVGTDIWWLNQRPHINCNFGRTSDVDNSNEMAQMWFIVHSLDALKYL